MVARSIICSLFWACLLLIVGCNTRLVEIKQSFVPINYARPMKVYPRLSGQACAHKLLFAFPIGDNSLSTALARLTRNSKKIDNLIGLQVEEKWAFWGVGYTSCTVVYAYPVVYKDALPKWALFSRDMMTGRMVKEIPVTPATGAVTHTAPPVGDTMTATAPPTPHTAGASVTKLRSQRSTTPTKRSCERTCAKFANIWQGSDTIRATIRRQCVVKCLKPENKAFRKCIQSASNIADIGKCNSL